MARPIAQPRARREAKEIEVVEALVSELGLVPPHADLLTPAVPDAV